MKYGIRVVAAITDFGRANLGTIGFWMHNMFGHPSADIFETQEAADRVLAEAVAINRKDFQWAVVPITKEECVRLRKEKKP